MTSQQRTIVETCGHGAETDTMTFPQIVGTLMEAGFEGYLTDFRRGVSTYYLPSGENLERRFADAAAAVAPAFDARGVNHAVREAQQQVPGYTYKGFCAKVATGGCAGYLVSFSGRRVLYFGRSGETHVEHFPQ
jgi:uncharacterized protein YbcV (DUF1398 family)